MFISPGYALLGYLVVMRKYHPCMFSLPSSGTSPSPDDLMWAGNITSNGQYKYSADFLALEATATGDGPPNFVPATPLRLSAWQEALAGHPDDCHFAQYILQGINKGFHIGAIRSTVSFQSRPHNMPTVPQYPQLVLAHLQDEVQAGHVLGPLPDHLARLCHISPIGLIPKPHLPGHWRLIMDFSSPAGHSVNDAIPSDVCHMHYTSILEAAVVVRQLGRGTLLAKMDLRQAYRVVPVHADDHPLLGIQWYSDTYIDTALPFGLRSAPKIFSALADALAWVISSRGVSFQLHYLDNFLFLGPPGRPACATALHQAQTTCHQPGVLIASHKTESPVTCLTFSVFKSTQLSCS